MEADPVRQPGDRVNYQQARMIVETSKRLDELERRVEALEAEMVRRRGGRPRKHEHEEPRANGEDH